MVATKCSFSLLNELGMELLQTQELKIIQEKESCIRVNKRELNRELCTGLSTLYTKL